MFKTFIRFSKEYSLLDYTSVECSTQSIFPISPIIFTAWNSIMPQFFRETYITLRRNNCFNSFDPLIILTLPEKTLNTGCGFYLTFKSHILGIFPQLVSPFFLLIQCLPSGLQSLFLDATLRKSRIKEQFPAAWKEVLCLASKWKLVSSI